MTKREKYVAKMKLQLDETNLKMSQLAAQAEDVKDGVRAEFSQEMARLRADAQAAEAQLDEVNAAGEDVWHKLVSEMERLRAAFTHSFAYFKSLL